MPRVADHLRRHDQVAFGSAASGIEAPRDVPIFRQELLPGNDKAVTPAVVVAAK